jgi:hypothetical protein
VRDSVMGDLFVIVVFSGDSECYVASILFLLFSLISCLLVIVFLLYLRGVVVG